MAASVWLLSAGAAHADMQVPILLGALREDERDAVIEFLTRERHAPPGPDGAYLQPLERDAWIELWIRKVEESWIAADAAGDAVLPAGKARDQAFHRLRLAVWQDTWRHPDIIEPFSYTLRDIRRAMSETWIRAGHLPLPRLRAELIFIEIDHAAHCGSVGCDSHLLLRKDGMLSVAGAYQPKRLQGGPSCAIALAQRHHGVPDLLELADIEGGPQLQRWDGGGFQSIRLRRAPRSTCCREGMDTTRVTRCPAE